MSSSTQTSKLGEFYNLHEKCKLKSESTYYYPSLGKNRTCVQKLLLPIRRSFLAARRTSLRSIYFRSYASLHYERIRHINSGYTYIIHPFSNFILVWRIILTLNYWLAALIIPLDVANHFLCSLEWSFYTNYGPVNLIICFLFTIDIILNFFTGYTNSKNTTIVLEPRKIALKYITTYFFIDLSTTLITLYYTCKIYYGEIDWPHYKISVIAFFRGARFWTFYQLHEDFVEWTGMNDIIYKILRFCIITYLFFHWAGIVAFVVPFLVYDVTSDSGNAWFHYFDTSITDCNVFGFYIKCLYNVVSLTLGSTVVENEPSEVDFLMSAFLHFCGLFYCGYLFVEIFEVMRSKFEPEVKYDEFMTQLREYMRYKQLPMPIQQSLLSFYEYRYRHAYFKEATIKSTLCSRLVTEINNYGCATMMKSVPLFNDLTRDMYEDLLQNLTLQLYLPKDLIIKAGTTGNHMYFLSCGTVAVYTLNGREVCHLYDGSFFGEVALVLKDRKRIATVVAVEICEVYAMNRFIFNKYFRSNEDLFHQVFQVCQQRIKETKAIEVHHQESFTEGENSAPPSKPPSEDDIGRNRSQKQNWIPTKI